MILSTESRTTLANSSGCPALLGNSIAFHKLCLALLLIIFVMFESNKVGAIVTARMPYLDKSLASGSVKLATAPLLAAYATCPICPSNAAELAIMIITLLSPSGPSGFAFVIYEELVR
jgi:hypothetical protein